MPLQIFKELMEQLVVKKSHRELRKYQETNKVSSCQKTLKTELRVTMETIVFWAWLQIETNTINSEAGGGTIYMEVKSVTRP